MKKFSGIMSVICGFTGFMFLVINIFVEGHMLVNYAILMYVFELIWEGRKKND